ncbi:MAG: hypothetical protein SF028_03930 [Candidatus Sumerlaeia bacterium]|nr:hypothetical protein [Candidatus Sumerlaeia bacterium]
MNAIVDILFLALTGYLAVGLLASVALHARGLTRFDEQARGAAFFFRVLATPGMVALWPLLLLRWMASGGSPLPQLDPAQGGSPRALRARHGLAWQALLVAVPLVLAGALIARVPSATSYEPLPAALLAEGRTLENPFPGYDISARYEALAGGARLALDVREELPIRDTLLYWMEPGRPAMLLGAVPAPGAATFAVPMELALADPQHLVILSYADRTALNESLRNSPKGGR